MLDKRMFENNRVLQIACGSNHVVVLATTEEGFAKEKEKVTGVSKKSVSNDTKANIHPPKQNQESQVLTSKTKQNENVGGTQKKNKT